MWALHYEWRSCAAGNGEVPGYAVFGRCTGVRLSAVGMELDMDLRRRVSGIGSLRQGERCERGDD